MKIVNTYKQGTITWFGYKHLFAFCSILVVQVKSGDVLAEWADGKLITKRTKGTV